MDWDVTGPWLCDCCGLALVPAGKPCPEWGSADGWTPMSQTPNHLISLVSDLGFESSLVPTGEPPHDH